MSMDLNTVLRDKKLWYGAGIAAAVGAYALYKKSSGTGSTAAAAPADNTSSGSGIGAFDSTSTDVAQQFGTFSVNVQHQLDAYGQQLTDTLNGLQQVQQQQPPTTPAHPTPSIHQMVPGTFYAN